MKISGEKNMEKEFKLVTLDFDTLVYSMAETREKADEMIEAFALENDLVNERRFILDFIMIQSKVEYVTYITYLSVPNGTKGSKGLQTLVLKNNKFVHFVGNKDDYHNYLRGHEHLSFDKFLEDNGLKPDISKVYVLTEVIGEDYNFYIPYK
jgi:hypothetical protein